MQLLNWIGLLLATALALGAASHALLRKSDSRSALGWVAVCLTFPVAGPVLYILFGVNRVRRSAFRMRRAVHSRSDVDSDQILPAEADSVSFPLIPQPFRVLERVGRNVLGTELIGGNCVEPLFNGDEAYPRMLQAMEGARQSIYLATYIMATDSLGRQFIDVLTRAVRRGVDVRVLVDGLGEKYSWPWVSRALHKNGVASALFIPFRFFPPELHINLRNHRKILVVDGKLGFTGGMNISQQHVLRAKSFWPVSDLHFFLRGPVVGQLQEAFVEDWLFATQERLTPAPMAPEPMMEDCLCRTVIDGPDCPHEPLKTLLTGIVSAASSSIKIMTPYFVPPPSFLTALQSARYRGVDVQIILPGRNNLPFVHWAARHILDHLLRVGISVSYQPAPFCHTKLILVDGCYVHLGSANLDNRSLRLNFELTLEVLDLCVAARLERHFEEVRAKSRPVTRRELHNRSLPVRLRDAFFWLFSPYL
ncbi:MAG: cardiolipin synthase [Desulfovibrionales bacterium]|nr:cardiolipin synthase [Desulfovibrionales bacterium]